MKHSHCIIVVLTLFTAFVGCKKVPEEVIAPDDMAPLLADIHTAEAVVEVNGHTYTNDSVRMAMKQSVLLKHNVTQADFDTSMVWYGRHMDKYISVYDDVIKILEKRSQQAGVQMLQSAMSAVGDSVDVWTGSPYVIISPKLPSSMIGFDMAIAENSEPGDIYTWRLKIIGAEDGTVRWNMLANYTDSVVEYVNMSTTNNQALRGGWNEVTFLADSTRTMERLRGVFQISVDGQSVIWVDSISLVRKRLSPDRYRERTRQRHYREY